MPKKTKVSVSVPDQRSTYPIITVDETGEAQDAAYTVGQAGSKHEPVITPRTGVPAMGTPEFDQYLKEWHKRHN